MNATYLRFEMLRLVRNKRFFIFSLVIPVALYLTIGGANRSQVIDLGPVKITFALYYMVSMASYGSMIAAVAGGGRIAIERTAGWNRQLRLTPLSPTAYFGAKVLTGYVMAMASIVLIYIAGAVFGVRIDALRWIEMTALLLVSLIPFAALGVLIGHLLSDDSVGPAIGGGSAFFAFLGGMWFPLQGGWLEHVGQAMPSYWMVQAAHIGIGAGGWPLKAWIVLIAWTAGLTLLATRAYRRDTSRA